jgi:hypothetical protein
MDKTKETSTKTSAKMDKTKEKQNGIL